MFTSPISFDTEGCFRPLVAAGVAVLAAALIICCGMLVGEPSLFPLDHDKDGGVGARRKEAGDKVGLGVVPEAGSGAELVAEGFRRGLEGLGSCLEPSRQFWCARLAACVRSAAEVSAISSQLLALIQEGPMYVECSQVLQYLWFFFSYPSVCFCAGMRVGRPLV